REISSAQVFERRSDLVEIAGRGGRNLMLEKEVFGEDFAGFEAGSVAFGAESGDSFFGERIDQSETERNLRTDHHEIDILLDGELGESGDIVGRDGKAGKFPGHSAISGSDDGFAAKWTLTAKRGEDVLSTAGSDDKDFQLLIRLLHDGISPRGRLLSKRGHAFSKALTRGNPERTGAGAGAGIRRRFLRKNDEPLRGAEIFRDWETAAGGERRFLRSEIGRGDFAVFADLREYPDRVESRRKLSP